VLYPNAPRDAPGAAATAVVRNALSPAFVAQREPRAAGACQARRPASSDVQTSALTAAASKRSSGSRRRLMTVAMACRQRRTRSVAMWRCIGCTPGAYRAAVPDGGRAGASALRAPQRAGRTPRRPARAFGARARPGVRRHAAPAPPLRPACRSTTGLAAGAGVGSGQHAKQDDEKDDARDVKQERERDDRHDLETLPPRQPMQGPAETGTSRPASAARSGASGTP
jgi:hypothetical protein